MSSVGIWQSKVSRAAIISTGVHVLIFIAFFSQEVLADNRGCEISCGNLLVDLILLGVTPTSWIVATVLSVFALRQGYRIAAAWSLGVLAASVLVVVLSALVLRSAFASSYRGEWQNEAGACAAIATAAHLREDDGYPGRVWVDHISAQQMELSAGEFRTSVTGETHVISERTRHYEWTCIATLDLEGRTLTARLNSFEEKSSD